MNKPDIDLWKAVTSFDALSAAWAKVDFNRGSAGGDGVGRQEFRDDRFARLNQLRADLLRGTYEPRPYRKVSIPKKKAGYRILTIPSIRDRIVHTSIATALTPILEPQFEDCSFAYRPNRGVTQAVARIEHWRDRGYQYVIEADIVRFFDSIDHALLLAKLRAALSATSGADPLLGLIEQMISDQGTALSTPGVGLVQGSPLSPILANLFLDALDEEIESKGVKLVRFADDFVILCKSRKKAERALEHCVEVLSDHQLNLHADGTRVVNFDKGFDFVGYLFLRTLALKEDRPKQVPSQKTVKSEVTDEGVIQLQNNGSRFDQAHRVLYVIDPRHRLTVRNRSFSIVTDEGVELIAIANGRVARIEVGPGVIFDHLSMVLAIETGVSLAILDGFGQTKGVVETALRKRAGLHLAQAKATCSESFRTRLAAKVVQARIRSQRTQLMRLNRRQSLPSVKTSVQTMKRALQQVDKAQTVEELMGAEGYSSAHYWPAIGTLSGQIEKVFRRNRPAKDPLNAAMNYLVGILERDMRAAIQGAGLHSGFAVLHGTRDRHEGFLFDMMEPFRAPLTEGLAVFLFTSRRLSEGAFTPDVSGRLALSDAARRLLIESYEAAVSKRVNTPCGGYKLGWRGQMLAQCRSFAKAVISGKADNFILYEMEA